MLNSNTVATVTDYANFNAIGQAQSTWLKQTPYSREQVQAVMEPFYGDFLATGQLLCDSTSDKAVALVTDAVVRNKTKVFSSMDRATVEKYVRVFLANWGYAVNNGALTDYAKYNCADGTYPLNISGDDYVPPVTISILGIKMSPVAAISVGTGIVATGLALWHFQRKQA